MKTPTLYLSHPRFHKSKVWLFADDTAVSSLEDAQILQQDLDHLHEWELKWDIEFNPSKCVVIHVTSSRTPILSQYLLHGQVLESVAGSKYLGAEFSSNLLFNNHIQNITTYQVGHLASSGETSGLKTQQKLSFAP